MTAPADAPEPLGLRAESEIACLAFMADSALLNPAHANTLRRIVPVMREIAAANEALVKERDALLRDAEVHDTPAWIANEQLNERVDRLAAERDAAHARAERLEVALRRFAWAAEAAVACNAQGADALLLLNDAKDRISWQMFLVSVAALAPEPPT